MREGSEGGEGEQARKKEKGIPSPGPSDQSHESQKTRERRFRNVTCLLVNKRARLAQAILVGAFGKLVLCAWLEDLPPSWNVPGQPGKSQNLMAKDG